MHERLIGEEIALDLPCEPESSGLVFGFVEGLIELEGDDVDAPDETEEALRTAVTAVCAGSDGAGERLVATLTVTAEGVEVRLSRPSGSESGALRLTVREA